MPKNSPRKALDPRVKRILQEMDPSWSGETPKLPIPISLSPEGLRRLQTILSRDEDPDRVYGRLAAVALRLFYLIAVKWGLSQADQMAILGVEGDRSIESLSSRGWDSSDFEALECFSHIIGIYRALHTLIPSEPQADAWIKKPNAVPMFNGDTALQVMKEGIVGLRSVRGYLEAEALGIHPLQGE